ncbi:allergen Tab y 5.0101 [Drosophila busckii]|uniref:allergen Tab y 5.0101 n=1 Tax=Drosophila busckii TaxID=30019 RepID=UPI0014332D40|nr:allergen Tab y 5.0101 [Drosophila busckii]
MASSIKQLLIGSLLFSIFVGVRAKPKYCSKEYCSIPGAKHVACGKEKNYLGPKCEVDAEVADLTDINEVIVFRINELRTLVARGGFNGFTAAARMGTLTWNKELADIAEYNVRKCSMHKDRCRNTKNHQKVGQLVAYRGLKGSTPVIIDILNDLLNLWFSEQTATTMNDIANYNGPDGKPKNGFLQLILEGATSVGCAALQQAKNGWLQTFFTCNFENAPVAGKPIFTTANTAGEGCILGKHPKHVHLCSEKENYGQHSPKLKVRSKQADSAPAEESAVSPAAGGETTPAAGGETTPAVGGETTPATGGETTPAAGGETTPAAGGETTPAAGGETTPAAGGEATPAAGGEATPAAGGSKEKPAEGSEAPPTGASDTGNGQETTTKAATEVDEDAFTTMKTPSRFLRLKFMLYLRKLRRAASLIQRYNIVILTNNYLVMDSKGNSPS